MPGSQAIDQSTPAEPGFSAHSSLYLYVCPGLLIFFNIYRILKCLLSVDIKHLNSKTSCNYLSARFISRLSTLHITM